MILDKFKEQFAITVATAFQQCYPEIYRTVGDNGPFHSPDVLKGIERPKDPKMGSLAFPIFKFLPILKSKPNEVTASVAARANIILSASASPELAVTPASGYLNASIELTAVARETIGQAVTMQDKFGQSTVGNGKLNLVEYSSPNIAKPFGVGHLRTTIIGNSLRRIYKKLGYEVIGINYPGDWGTQFGKMIVAFRRWGSESTFQGEAVKNLLDLYVKFHAEAETDKSLDDEARVAFKKLEDGDPEATKLWERMKEVSFEEWSRVYGILGVEFDLVYGESFLNDKMEAVIERLQKDGLTSTSRGALVVDLNDPQLPPALLKKQDGATLYITRDLAGLIWRWEKYHFNESLYVVGVSQSDHFKQALKVIDMMEQAENLPAESRMTGRVKHVDFGWVKFGEKTMSTRQGNIIFLEDVINQAIDLAKQKIREKNPNLANFDDVAQMIGVGAVIFSQLSVRRQKDVNFDWDEVLSFEGETGPYLQYTHARLCSLERMYGKPITAQIDHSLLNHDEERLVIETIAEFEEAIQEAARLYDPNCISTYLLRLASAFNKFYQRKDDSGRIDKIISDDPDRSAARMALVQSVRIVMNEGLNLLGLRAPYEM
ncbi:MAG: arginine--tRNA ligase [bacterium]|nr:arginine--tRNA ligase [bacterium]